MYIGPKEIVGTLVKENLSSLLSDLLKLKELIEKRVKSS